MGAEVACGCEDVIDKAHHQGGKLPPMPIGSDGFWALHTRGGRTEHGDGLMDYLMDEMVGKVVAGKISKLPPMRVAS